MTNQTLNTLLFTFGMPIAISVAMALGRFLYSLFPVDKQVAMERAARQVVLAVEQTYRNLPGSGALKKAEAVSLLNGILKSLRIPVNDRMVNVLIESAVAQLPASPAPAASSVAVVVAPPSPPDTQTPQPLSESGA